MLWVLLFFVVQATASSLTPSPSPLALVSTKIIDNGETNPEIPYHQIDDINFSPVNLYLPYTAWDFSYITWENLVVTPDAQTFHFDWFAAETSGGIENGVAFWFFIADSSATFYQPASGEFMEESSIFKSAVVFEYNSDVFEYREGGQLIGSSPLDVNVDDELYNKTISTTVTITLTDITIDFLTYSLTYPLNAAITTSDIVGFGGRDTPTIVTDVRIPEFETNLLPSPSASPSTSETSAASASTLPSSPAPATPSAEASVAAPSATPSASSDSLRLVRGVGGPRAYTPVFHRLGRNDNA